ncbi:uncharacterized protein LOC123904566, partial [Trifolium pratense]|uniref:uncharacterized protein LOC123904566 n=1 Tax=Trifolium pratense TaxID=57577 RepID=UPI001E695DD7
MAFAVWNKWFTVPVGDPIYVRWEKPGVGWIKYNVDATFVGGSGVTSMGLCFRNTNGQFVADLTQWQQLVYSVVEAEAWALLHAMKETIHCGFEQVQFESDSMIMAGRGNERGHNQMADAIATLTNIVARDHQPGREDEMRLERFMKHNPKLFIGGYAPEAAVKWIEEEELCAFSPHYNTVEAENDKCVKFESGLRPDIKHLIGFSQIRDFATLVDKCRICDDDGKAKTNYYKAMSDKRGRGQDRGKPYGDKGKKVAETGGGKKKGGGQCYKCGEMGHKSYECPKKVDKCFNCGRLGHKSDVCQVKVTCFNCGEEGHKSPMCKKPKKTMGKVFALSGDGADRVDNLIRGTCFIYNTLLIAIIDTGTTHSFISVDCVKRLSIPVSEMSGRMEIETPASGSVTTRLVCRDCPVTVFGRHFGMDLVCIQLSGIDVIFGMNWLIFNRVHINCCEKTVVFPKPEESLHLMSKKEVVESLKEPVEVYALFASLKVEGEVKMEDLPVVCEFPDVFPEDVSDVPPKREVEFTIDLVPGTSPISMAPYRMSASELNELKKQLEELLEKKFIRPSVSP